MASNISINQASKTYLLNYLNQYLVKGGFPEVVTKNLDAAGYLQTLTESILLKDVIKRHKIRRVEETYNLARYIFGNFSCQHSAGSVRRALNMRSVHTAQKYLRLLEEAYLLLPLNCFSYHFKRQIRAPQKIYLADTGFAAAAFTTSENLGRLMENAVFLELLRQGHRPNLDLFYYKQEGNKEVDFLVQEAGKITKLIQVCQTLADPKTKKRETRLLSGLGDGDTERVIITWEEEGASALPLYRFLLSSCQP
jgi:predicted AAA+ superfamily ATPase